MCGGRLEGASVPIERLDSGCRPGPGALVLAATLDEARAAAEGQASALLCPAEVALPLPRVVVEHPRLAYALLLEALADEPRVSPHSVVSPQARLDEGVQVAAGAVVEAGAVLGARTRVGPCAYVGPGVQVGPDCRIEAGATLLPGTVLGRSVTVGAGAVLGCDGYGFVQHEGRHLKIPQVGRVEIEDEVRIGEGTCIDRATTGCTRIGQGTVLGKQVQVGHNVHIGRRCQVGDQVGIAGSSRVGNDCVLESQAGMAGKAELGDGSRLRFRAGTMRKSPPGADLAGFLARPYQEMKRIQAALHRLPRALERLEQLEKRLEEPCDGGS
jgi:UDP-3-O-[3-hydroxymyristoyl] glucosamine N-acyltransferase